MVYRYIGRDTICSESIQKIDLSERGMIIQSKHDHDHEYMEEVPGI